MCLEAAVRVLFRQQEQPQLSAVGSGEASRWPLCLPCQTWPAAEDPWPLWLCGDFSTGVCSPFGV